MVTIFHLNLTGLVYVNIEIPNDINLQDMNFFHKSEDGITNIILKNKKINKIISNFQFKISPSMRILNIKDVIPKIINLNDTKLIFIKYNVTKNIINEEIKNNNIYINNILDYIRNECECNQQIENIYLKNIYCKQCNNELLKNINKEFIFDFNPIKIEESLHEMFQCSHNKKAVKENHSFNNLFDKFKERINIDNFNIWCIKNESNKFNNEKLYCEKCRINLGNYDEINHYIFYKFNIFKISIDIFKQNENNKIIKISNFFAEKYLNLLFGYAIENNIISMLIYSETIGIRFKFINNSIGIIKISNLISNNVEIISKEFFLIYYTIINGLDIENDNYKTELKINITMQDIFSLYKIIESNKIQFKKEILFYKINTQNIKNEENIYIYKL
jgi:hypothetical protein